jgi:hypothetical protein
MRRPRGPGRSSAPPTTAIDLSSIIGRSPQPLAVQPPVAAQAPVPVQPAAVVQPPAPESEPEASQPAAEPEASQPAADSAPIAGSPLSWTAHLNADAAAAQNVSAGQDRSPQDSSPQGDASDESAASEDDSSPHENSAPQENSAPHDDSEGDVADAASGDSSSAASSAASSGEPAPRPAAKEAPAPIPELVEPIAPPVVRAAPAAVTPAPTPHPAFPSVPPPLVEPPVPQRKAFTAELATQAMSIQEIADAKAAPRTIGPWTRSVPTQAAAAAAASTSLTSASTSNPANAADNAEISTQAMSVAEIAEVAKAAEISTQAMSVAEIADAESGPDRGAAPSPMTGLFARAETARAETARAETARGESARGLPELPTAPPSSGAGIQRSAIHPPMPRGQKILLGIVGGLVLVLVLVAVFLLASRLGEQSVTADISSEETAAPAVVEPDLTAGPVAAGDYEWSELLGGECLQPFESAWAEEFTVVGCDTAHAAQLLLRGELTQAASIAYPGEEALATEVTAACSAPTVLNYAAAGVMADIELSSSYPANSTDWDEGNRAYFCFVDRTSGEAITGDLRVPAV